MSTVCCCQCERNKHTWKLTRFRLCSIFCLFAFVAPECCAYFFVIFLPLFFIYLICFVNVICALCIHQHGTNKTAPFFFESMNTRRANKRNANSVFFVIRNTIQFMAFFLYSISFIKHTRNTQKRQQDTMFFCHANMPKIKSEIKYLPMCNREIKKKWQRRI